MKHTIRILTALLLCLLLAGCGGDKDVTGNVQPVETQAATPTGAVTPVETEAPETEAPETEAPETEAPAETTLPESDLSLGRMEGGVYTNTYVGFACTLSSDWTFYSAEELNQLPADVNEMFSGSELAERMENVTQFTDMMAENANDLVSINVLYQKISLQERLAYAALTEEQVIEAVLAQRDLMEEAYNQAGMTLLSMEKDTVTFLGEERTAIRSAMLMEDIPYFTLQIFDHHLGEYTVTTTLASYLEDKTDSLLTLFTPVE